MVTLAVPEFVGFALSPNNIAFNVNNLGTVIITPLYFITNTGNVPIDLSVKANGDFNGPETISISDGNYAITTQNGRSHIDKTHSTIFQTGLNPQNCGTSTITPS